MIGPVTWLSALLGGCAEPEVEEYQIPPLCEQYDDGDLLPGGTPGDLECRSPDTLADGCRVMQERYFPYLPSRPCLTFESLLRESEWLLDPMKFQVILTIHHPYRCDVSDGSALDVIAFGAGHYDRRDTAWFDGDSGELIAYSSRPDGDDTFIESFVRTEMCCDGQEAQTMWWSDPMREPCTDRRDYTFEDFVDDTGTP